MFKQVKKLILWVGFSGLIGLYGAPRLHGRIDFGGNGVSELWEAQFEGVVPGPEDTDGDGTSDHDEGIAGTDPLSPESSLNLSIRISSLDEVVFEWPAEAGKAYRVETWNVQSRQWEEVASLLPTLVDGPRSLTMMEVGSGIFRLGVSDVDLDGDGLSAWEEIQLGMSDADNQSSGGGESDFIAALRRLEAPEGLLTADGIRLPRILPDQKAAARFLMRASFGPNDESIARVMELGLTGWMDEQFSLPVLTLRTATSQNGLPWSASIARPGWWRAANVAEDQLRHRMAYALSQILVVNFEPGSRIGDNPFVQTSFYDFFVNGAFGSYRDVLENVTYSPSMGFYLSYLKNRKTDDPENPSRFPDENFAREIMQLFTIGLWELNVDGSRKIDDEGNFLSTYDNGTITEMAKVFTGMSFTTTGSGQPATSFFDAPRGNDYFNPMKVWDEEHEPGPKSIINGVELDGTQTGEEEVQATLDALMTHESMAPFLSRLLIQRFTSSNPSKAYLSRVSRAWNEHREQTSSHLAQVLRAILLDPEVLTPNSRGAFTGKAREPIVRFTHLARAFGIQRPDGKYNPNVGLIQNEFGQFPMLSPTVFNFYSPDFSPNLEFRLSGMVAPELQLASLSQLILSASRYSQTADGYYWGGKFDYANELPLAGDSEALLDRVDLLLTGGQLSPTSRAAILQAIDNETTDKRKVEAAVSLVSQSMESVILR